MPRASRSSMTSGSTGQRRSAHGCAVSNSRRGSAPKGAEIGLPIAVVTPRALEHAAPHTQPGRPGLDVDEQSAAAKSGELAGPARASSARLNECSIAVDVWAKSGGGKLGVSFLERR